MQQHLMQMQPMMATVTTDHIQQYLDENKSLILKIVESQNSGKLNECAENQARLQKNLMYLAAIADSQPQPHTMHSQFPSSGVMHPGSHYLQHQQAQQIPPQSLMAASSSMLYSQQQFLALQQQEALHSQLGMKSGGRSGLHMRQNEATSAGSKQDIGSAEGRGGSSGGHGSEGGVALYLKAGEDAN
ncbi:hypothetical protein CsSME_00027881 [Camellia sinensis var. sinensis]